MTKQNPARWAFDKAQKLFRDEADDQTDSWLRMESAFARYVEEHEKPPVDEDVLFVRELIARMLRKSGSIGFPEAYLRGDHDGSEFFIAYVEAYREMKAEKAAAFDGPYVAEVGRSKFRG